MKKLMTMIVAVATAFGLYAAGNTWSPEGDALGNTLDVLKADDGTTGVLDRYWSYSDGAGVAAGEAEVTAEGQLTLKTGSKILTRNIKGVMSGTETDFEPCDIPDESNEVGLFFDTKAIFGAPCDDFAALADTDKFAAFFLDETELVGMPDDFVKGTNLWVIGSDGTTETAFRMQLLANNGDPETIDETWLNAEKRVVVKAYANGNGARPGFVVYVANNFYGSFAKVIGKAPISNGTIGTYTKVTTADYLTGTIGVLGRYTDCQLVLGRVAATDGLFGEAFKGTGTITGLTVGDTCPSDLTDKFTETQFMTVDAKDVTISDVTGATYDSEKRQFAGKNDTEVTFKVTSDDPGTKTLITISGVDYTENQGVYTITFDDQKTLTVAAVAPAATVNGTAYATFADALEAAAKLDTVALALNGPAAMGEDEAIEIALEKVWTIDLNGQVLTFTQAGMNSCIENEGTLTITNSGDVATGKIVNAAAENPSTLIDNGNEGSKVVIQAGIFDGVLFDDEAEGDYEISGGSFRSPDNGTDAFAYDVVSGKEATLVSNYWTVQEKVAPAIEYVTFTVAAGTGVASYQVFTNDDVAVTGDNNSFTVESNAVVKITATADTGYEKVTIEGDNVEVTDGVFTATEATSAITISATLKKVKAIWDVDGVATTNEVDYGTVPTVPAAPTKTHATFTGWLPVPGDAITEDTTYTAQFTAWLKYAADLYTNEVKLAVQAQLGNGDHFYAKGEKVTATYAGVVTNPEFIGEGTYYISKIVDLATSKVATYTYNGTDYAMESDTIGITLSGTTLTYEVTTGDLDIFAKVYFTKYEAPAPTPDPVEPGEDIKTDTPQALADEINNATDKTQWIKAPVAAGELTADQQKDYASWFKAVPGEGKVTIELDPAKVETLRATVNAEVVQKIKPAELAAMTGATGTVQIDAIPGFYYAVKQGNGIGTMKVENAGIAAGTSGKVDLTMKKYNGAGFYTIIVSEKAIAAEN